MVLDIAGYNRKKMQRIEDRLVEDYMQQDEIDDFNSFIEQKAPKEFKQYMRAYDKAKERLKERGIRA